MKPKFKECGRDPACPHCNEEYQGVWSYIDHGDGASTDVTCHNCGLRYTVEPYTMYRTRSVELSSEDRLRYDCLIRQHGVFGLLSIIAREMEDNASGDYDPDAVNESAKVVREAIKTYWKIGETPTKPQ